MLIDWITARVDNELIPAEIREKLDGVFDRIMCISPNGEIRWQKTTWNSIRTDSHQIAVRNTSHDFWIQGSPARTIGDGCNVFSAPPSSTLDVEGCLTHMTEFVGKNLGIVVPPLANWRVSRLDITRNLLLDSLDEVREALGVLKNCNGGRYRVSQQAGDSVYWSHRSKHRSGKAYAKGPHLQYLGKRKTFDSKIYTQEELDLADRLLRLELKLAREWFKTHVSHWQHITPEILSAEWDSYFKRTLGGAEIVNDHDLKTKIYTLAPTDGQGKSAYSLWLLIKNEGWEKARHATTKTTWYRNLKTLHEAGLSDADLSMGVIVPFRKKIFTATSVNSWDELKQVANG